MVKSPRRKLLFLVLPVILLGIIIVMGVAIFRLSQNHQELQNEVQRLHHNEQVLTGRVENLSGYRQRLNQHETFIEILNQTMALRELPTREVVPIQTVGEDFLLSFLEKQWEEELGEQLLHIEDILKNMALIEPDYDIREEVTALYIDQTAGFYDYHEGLFYIMETFDMQNVMGKIIVSHELTHFLQDQHFNIEELMAAHDASTDQQTTILSVLEGDATLAMMEWSMEYGIPGSLQDLTDFLLIGDAQMDFADTPQIIQDMLLEPYLAGIDFFTYLQNADVEDWRNKPFKKPPVSMEMVLHPEKYLAYDNFPRELDIPEHFTENHGDIIYTDVFGELYLRSVIREFNQHEELKTNEIAAGWNGDKNVLFEDGLILWMVCFDTQADEDDFEAFLEASHEYWQSRLEKNDVSLQWDKEEDIFYLKFQPVS